MATPTPAPVLDPGPAVPPKVRTAVYLSSLGVAAVCSLVTGVTAAVAPGSAGKVLAICGAVTGAVSLVVSGLASLFRPTAASSGQ